MVVTEHKNSGLGIFSHKNNDEYHFLVDSLSSYYDELRSETKEKIYRTIGNDLTVDFNENILCGCLSFVRVSSYLIKIYYGRRF